jgi:hypothetical protein
LTDKQIAQARQDYGVQERMAVAVSADTVRQMLDDGWSLDDCEQVFGRKRSAWQTITKAVAELTVHRARTQPQYITPDHARWMLEPTLESFRAFVSTFSGQELPDHCNPWVQAYLDHANVVLNVPVAHAKTHVSIWLAVWETTRNRDVRILVISKTAEASKLQVSNKVGAILEYNQALISTYGAYAPDIQGDAPWSPSKGVFVVQGATSTTDAMAPTILARGRKTQLLGFRSDIVICDDITDAATTRSPTENDELSRWLHEEVLTRLMPQSKALVIGQRVAYDDTYSRLVSQVFEQGPTAGRTTWHHENYPAVIRWPTLDDKSDAEVLWPEVWSYDALMSAYERVGGKHAFECLYQQNPMPSDGGLIYQEDVEKALDRERDLYKGAEYEGRRVRVLSIDPSPTMFTGVVLADVHVAGEDKQSQVTVLSASRQRITEFPKFEKFLLQTIMDKKPEFVIIEESSFLTWMTRSELFDEVRKFTRVIYHKTGSNKIGDFGVHYLTSMFSRNQIHLPYGNLAAQDETDNLLTELTNFPDYKYSDLVMALWFISYNLRRLNSYTKYDPAVDMQRRIEWASTPGPKQALYEYHLRKDLGMASAPKDQDQTAKFMEMRKHAALVDFRAERQRKRDAWALKQMLQQQEETG